MIAGSVAIVVVSAFAVGRTTTAEREEPCSGGATTIAAAWDPVARAGDLQRIAGLSSYGRELVPIIAGTLHARAVDWAAQHHDACARTRSGEQSALLLDRRMRCLERGRAAVVAVAEMARGTDAAHLPEVARAVQAIPDPTACGDPAEIDPPPSGIRDRVATEAAALERVQLQLAAGRYEDALDGTSAIVASSRALAYAPLLAEALAVEGRALQQLGIRQLAMERYGEAIRLATRSGASAIAIEATARRAWLEGTGGAPGTALGNLDFVDAFAHRAGTSFANALLHNNVGGIQLALGRRDDARKSFEQALGEAKGVEGRGAIELLAIRTNLALVVEPAERDEHARAAQDKLAELLGENHPDTLAAAYVRATTTVAVSVAAVMLETICPRLERADLTGSAARCWLEAADVHEGRGERDLARAALDRTLALAPDGGHQTREARAYDELWHDRPASAALRAVLEILWLPRLDGEPWYRTFARAKLELALGLAQLALGDRGGAAVTLARVVAVLEPIVRDHPQQMFERRLASARAALARS